MSIGIGENVSKSIGFAKESLVGKWLNWLLLLILTVIPIINWIASGTYLKIYRGEEPKVEGIGSSFIQGLLATIITIIYMIIPSLIASLLSSLLGIVGAIIGAIISIIFALIAIPAVVRFAQDGFGAAFKFGELFGMIGKVGWVKYILSIILWGIIVAVVVAILSIIPIIGWVVLVILVPFIAIASYKFVANLFA